jgi:Predicted pyridoxal phosphate-dependent enzyme apparently involved in regulation of cell wall biogenesis
MTMPNPYQSVIDFENVLAEFCGSKYAVCVESCTSALFLSLMWMKRQYDPTSIPVKIPSRTYPGVPCSIIHAGYKVEFQDVEWEGQYELGSLNIKDAALRFKRGMFHGGFQCISFHAKKLLPIGRGGAILTDNIDAAKWLRRARFDGRNPVPLMEDHFDMLGWNCYLQPEQAARGLMLFQALISKYPDGPPDLIVAEQGYPDLSLFPVYQQ